MDHLTNLPPSILKARVFPYLCYDDIANVNLVSKSLFRTVSEVGENAEILREERFTTRMGFRPWGVNSGASVSQRQPFRFLLRAATGTTLQVNITLENIVWDERHNSRTMEGCRAIGDPSSTSMDVEIWQKRDNSVVELFFKHDSDWYESIDCSCGSISCYRCLGFVVLGLLGEEGMEGRESYIGKLSKYRIIGQLNAVAKENLHCAMVYIWECVKHIARFPDGKIYPSAEYMMSTLPSHLRPYFPSVVDSTNWLDGHIIDDNKRYPKDRVFVVEWDYRPAKTRQEWYRVLGDETPGKLQEFQLDELSWYKQGYWSCIKPPADCVTPPIHHKDTLWGNVFVQAARPALGCESIHFVSPGKAFVSYESQRMYESGDHPEDRLRIYFRNVTFDGRTFRGELDNLGLLPFRYFIYELTFESSFTTIVSGEVTGFLTHSTSQRNNPLGIQDKDFAVTILVNAGLWNSIMGSHNAHRSEGDSSAREQKISILLARLQFDGACSEKHNAAVHQIASAPTDPVDCSFNF